MPMYTRNTGKHWDSSEVQSLQHYAGQNMPTRVIGLKLGRTEAAIRTMASQEGISLKPVNRSPYNRKTN